MRIISLRQRSQSMPRSVEERENRRIPWGKYVYVGILVCLGVGFAKWGIDGVLYVRGSGILEAESTYIGSNSTARIKELNCNLDERISKDAPLVIMETDTDRGTVADMECEIEERATRLKDTTLAAESEIKLLAEKKRGKEAEIRTLTEDYYHAKDVFDLGALTRAELLKAARDLEKAEREFSLVSTEMESAEDRFSMLLKRDGEYEHRLGLRRKGQTMPATTVVRAPENGTVAMIYKHRGEIVRQGEPILKIINPSRNCIKTYFDGSDEKHVRVGEEVMVTFENGTRSKGKIKKVYPVAFPLPPQYRRAYGHQQKAIVAEVVPVNADAWPRILDTKASVVRKKEWFS